MPVTIPFCTLLLGDDIIGRSLARESLIKQLTGNSGGTLAVETYDSDRESLSSFVARLMTPSLFGEPRLFAIRHGEEIDARQAEALDILLDFDAPDLFLVVESSKVPDKRKKQKGFEGWISRVLENEKKVPNRFSVQLFACPPDYKIADWLVTMVPRICNRSIQPADAAYLVDQVGCDTGALNAEIEKIDLVLPDTAPITRKAIAAIVEGTRAISGFELAAALGKRDLSAAVDAVESLFTATFYAPPVISAVFRHFWALFRMRQLEREEPGTMRGFLQAVSGYNRSGQQTYGMKLGKAAGLLADGQERRLYPVMVKSGIVSQAGSFTDRDLADIVTMLYDYDIGVKTGRVEASRQSMHLLCYRIATAGKFAGNGVAG